MRNQQPKKFTRLLLAASISIASFSLVACGGDHSNEDPFKSETDNKDKPTNPTPTNPTTPVGKVTKSASSYLASYDGNVTPTTVASWEATTHDDYVNQLQVDGDELIIIKQWFNGTAKSQLIAMT